MRISNRARLIGPVVLAARTLWPAGLPVSAQADQRVPAWPTEGWPSADPVEQGLAPGLPAVIEARVAAETPLLSALLVVRGGYLVYEGYFNGFQPGESLHTWSVTKSVTSIAVGIAFREGLLADLDQTLGELIPEHIPAEADPRVSDISLRHLLTSTSGWAWDGRTNFARHAETDRLDLMLARPMACDPGECFEYDSTNTNLLSFIIQTLSGETMADYLQPRLFEPLGIARSEWLTTGAGFTRGAGGLELSPADMAKIGFLYLNGGQWDGERIVDQAWVAESTREQASGTSAMSGVNIGGAAYGYQWWVKQVAGYPAFIANGYGGQTIYVVPELDLVVVTGVAETDVNTPEEQQPVMPIIEEAIVPAALGE